MKTDHRTRLRAWLAATVTALLVAGGLSIGAVPASAAPGDVSGATLNWGFKQSFRNYISGPIAHGGWQVSAGVTDATPFAWSGGHGDASQPDATGSVAYSGSIHFTGHQGMGVPPDSYALDLTLSNVRVQQDNAATATIVVDVVTNSLAAPMTFVTYSDVSFAEVNLAGATDNSTADTVAFDGAPSVLTADGAIAFSDFYAAGTALDPVSFSWPVEAAPISAPALSLSKSTGLDPLGETITVTGDNIKTGFANAHGGGEAGVYAQIGYLDSEWRPSAGAPSAARSNAYTVWVKETAPSASYLAWIDNGNGTADFSWTVTIDHATLAEKARAGATLAVFIVGGGGVVQAANELVVPISFNVPTVSVSKAANLDSTGETVTVTGTGFLPNPPKTSGTRSPLSGKFGGSYVVFGKFADDWRPSKGAPGSARKAGDTKWAVLESDLPSLGSMPGGVILNADGTFEVTLTVKKGFGEPETGNYGIYTYPGSGATYGLFETFTPISFAPLPTELTFTTSPSGQVTEGGLVTLRAQLASPIPGVVAFTNGSKTLGTVAPTSEGVATLVVPSLPVGAHTLKATFTPTDTANYASSTASIAYTVVAKPVIAAGSLTWGFKESFRSYVTGPIAHGSITTSGVGTSGGAFVFGQGTGGSFNGSTGTSLYTGSVRFLGHGGVLDLRLGNPVVQVDSATSGTLLMSVNGSTVPFARLALASGSKSVVNGAVSYAGVPATLTAQGAAAFVNGDSQFYPAGTALDPVSFVIGSPSSPTSGTRTVAAFVAPSDDVPPTPPATTGITLDGASADSLVEGGEVTVTAEGFEPNEQGVKVVIYSDPVVLATDASADARGVVTWTGRLPAGLTGDHTLTFQGSVARGVQLTIAEKVVATMSGCLVEDASIDWGFKEAFRSYISGSIANGEWTVAEGATYETPNFGWNAGEGSYDPESGEGVLAFQGSVQFTGHGGVLDTTIANPQLRFDGGDSATLLIDVTGTTQDGETIDQRGVEFATVDLASAEVTSANGEYTFTAAPTVLAPAGAAAFGTYEVGTEFDPITVSFTTASECAAPGAVDTDDAGPADAVSGPDLGWRVWLIAGLLLVAAAVVATIVIVRRRRVA